MDYKLTEFVDADSVIDDSLTIPFDTRQKSRFAATTDKGKQVGLFLNRGHVLRSGEIVTGEAGYRVAIRSAAEAVSVLRSDDALLFAKACYHLGNRHVPLQILDSELRYLEDHVLDHMLAHLGVKVSHEVLPFEPESGAYHSHEH